MTRANGGRNARRKYARIVDQTSRKLRQNA